MTFVKGQSGNPLGRARRPNIYVTYKDKYFSKRSRSNKRIMDNLYKAAEIGEPWAIKEWLRIYIPQATIHIDSTSREISEKRLLVMNAIGHLSDEAKRNLYDVLTQKESEPVNAEAEVIEES